MKTDRLLLRQCSVLDLEKLVAGAQAFEAETGLKLIPGYLEFPEALPYSLAKINEVPEGEKPWWAPYLFVLPEANAVIGLGGYKGPPHGGAVEIGYGVAPDYRGRGYATEATIGLVELAFASGITKVVAHTLAEVNASTRVLQKAGFTKIEEVVDPDDGLLWRWERG